MRNRTKSPDGKVEKDGTPATILPEGTLLSQGYRIRWQGTDGHIVTYKAMKDGQFYLIREARSSDAEAVKALTQQQFVLEQVSHPGIQRCVEMFKEDGWQYLVLEHVSGTSLDKSISREPNVFMDEKTLFEWASRLYELFAYLHQHKSDDIYGDIIVKKVVRSPENIVRDNAGAFHIIDVGAPSFKDDDRTSSSRESILQPLAAPEILEGREIDERSDVFTIGAILYYLLSNGRGRSPDNDRYIPLSQINGNVSPPLEALVMKATSDEPGERFPSITAMKVAHSELMMEKPAAKEQEKKKALDGRFVIPAICTALALVMILIVSSALSSGKRSQKQQGASLAGQSEHRASLNPSLATKSLAVTSVDPMLYPDLHQTPEKTPPASTLSSPSPAASSQSTLISTPTPSIQRTEAHPSIASSQYPTSAPHQASRSIAPAPSGQAQEEDLKGISSIPQQREDMLAELFSVDRKKITEAPKTFYYYNDFSIVLPDNYFLITESDNLICFAAIDENKGESSLRVIQIKILDYPIEAGIKEEAWRYYKLSLVNNGATILDEKRLEKGTFTHTSLLGFAATYKWIPPSPINVKIKESYIHTDYFMTLRKTSRGKERQIVIFMASAPEKTYNIYEKAEFSPSLESIYLMVKIWN